MWPRVLGKTNRPLLNQIEPEKALKRLIKDRNPIYSKADVTVESKPKSLSFQMVEKIVSELKKSNVHLNY